jgi:hypothetical protein
LSFTHDFTKPLLTNPSFNVIPNQLMLGNSIPRWAELPFVQIPNAVKCTKDAQ